MTDAPPPDTAAREAIGESLDETLMIEAAAGTGKTTELVNRILRVLSTGRATMVEIVAVTFTERAAGELKLRLRERLEIERAGALSRSEDTVSDRLERALETLEEAHVNTIHGFCADLLKERPVEAAVDPLFAVLTEPQAARMYARAFRGWLEERLTDPPEGLRRALRRSAAGSFAGGDGDGPVARLEGAGRAIAEWRDFPAPWRRPPFDREAEIARIVAAVHDLSDLTAQAASDRDNLFLDTDAVRRASRQMRLEASFGQRDADEWEARLVDLARERRFSRPRKGYGSKFGTNVNRADVLSACDQLLGELQQFRVAADADLAACLQQELAGATERYQALKQSAGALDFADLLSRSRGLLRSNGRVRRYLQGKFARVFVDEFQDTDPVQAEILLLLCADNPDVCDWDSVRPTPGKLFIVGDPKQAIYRFRGADVGTYWHVRRQIETSGGRVLQLTTSYRSVPGIQRFVNAAFAAEMTADQVALQAGYVPLAEHRSGVDTQPAVVALPVPRPYAARGPLKPSAKAIEKSLPDVVGAWIAWVLDERNGWTVVERQPDGSQTRVPIKPKHIAVLFRRFVSFDKDMTRDYTSALEARGVPHLLVGGKAFHGREEVETMRAALSAIEWPDDELSVFATLKGSLFAIGDDQLLEYRHRFGAFHPFRIPAELGGNSGHDLALTGEETATLVPIADALRLVQELHRRRNSTPVADTIGRLLTQTRAHVGFVLRPAGEQALANVLHIAELARQYEGGGGISFRGFIDEIGAAAASAAPEAPILEESSDGVRLMTVHKAKGLEFPVVVLADLTCHISRNDASRHVDARRRLYTARIGGWAPHDLYDHEAEEVARDRAEGVRLAYVAATRARDLLVVPGLGDGPWDGGWLDPLNRALYPPIASRRTAGRGPGCPVFSSKDSVLDRPGEEIAQPSTVCPGLHSFEVAGYSVVWWDPHASSLVLGAEPSFGLRREDLIVRDVPRNVVDDGRERYEAWRRARETVRTAGAEPSLRVQTVGEWAREERDPADEVDVTLVDAGVRGGDRLSRPRGPAFGSLVHALLGLSSFTASLAALTETASAEARILGLDDDAASAAASVAHGVLRHDILRRAAAAEASGRCRRETPVTLAMPDGTLVEGVVDLAFEEGGRWTVVDYKTDGELAGEGERRYRRQVALYASAISRATGARAAGVLVRI